MGSREFPQELEIPEVCEDVSKKNRGPLWALGALGAPLEPLERPLRDSSGFFVIKGAQKRAAKNPTFAEVAVNRPGRV